MSVEQPAQAGHAEQPRAYRQIVEHIETALTNGELQPGDRLPSERELVNQFGVARSSVREALRVLESAGMVHSRPSDRRGPEVLGISAAPLVSSFTRLAAIARLSLAELLQFRMSLEGTAHFLAARLRSDEQLLEMERAIERMSESVERGHTDFSDADLDFHAVVAQASGNQLIQLCGEAVREALFRLIADKITSTTDHRAVMLESVRHHRAVLAAIRDGDGDRAQREIRASLFAYYGEYLDDDEQRVLRELSTAG